MSRIIKEPAARRNEILDAARRLVYSKGYEQMTIQDILDQLQISKGAFYHYFDSKQSLLEAMIERMLDEAEQIILPIVQDPQLAAIDKLERYFSTVAGWKTAQKEFLLALLRIWYTDDNAIVREKIYAEGANRIQPMLVTIFQQGVQEGVLTIPFPEQIGDVVYSMMLGLSDNLARLMISCEPDRQLEQRLETTVAAYTDALEQVLRAPPGSIQLVNVEVLKQWVISP